MDMLSVQFSRFKAPGKSMFSSIPEKDWKVLYHTIGTDCEWALRSLFIKEGNNSILIDTGFGNTNMSVLQEYGVKTFKTSREVLDSKQIKNVSHLLLTHLHLDHCGGILNDNHSAGIVNLFPESKIIVSSQQMNVALNPSEFEAESFQPEVVKAIAESKNLFLIEKECFLFPWLELCIFNGHTQGLMIPVIHSPKASIAFVGDLIPSAAHLILESAMEYDYNQMLAIAERQEFLEEAYENEYILFFQHDIYNECCSLKKEKNKILPDKYFKIEDFLDLGI